MPSSLSGVVGEAEGDESAQVEAGDGVVEPVVVLGDAAVAEFACAAGEPGDDAFDHGPVLAVFGFARVTGCLSGGAEDAFVRVDGEFAAAFGGGAAGREWAGAAVSFERGAAAWGG